MFFYVKCRIQKQFQESTSSGQYNKTIAYNSEMSMLIDVYTLIRLDSSFYVKYKYIRSLCYITKELKDKPNT